MLFSRFVDRPFVVCAGVALTLRLAYLLELSTNSVLFAHPTLDEQEILLAARALLRGEGFGELPFFKAPLYTAWVAASRVVFGEMWFWGVRFVQLLGGVLLVVMGMDVATRLVGGGEPRRRLAGWTAGLLLALYAPLIRLEHRLILDFLVVLFQSAMIWAMVRWLTNDKHGSARLWLTLAGGFGALAWLTRPTITPVLPLLALLPVWLKPLPAGVSRRTRWKSAGWFLLPPLLVMGGVVVRNAHVGGEAMLLPWQGGYNLYHANRSGASGRYYQQERFAYSASGNPTRALMVNEYEQAVAEGEVPAASEGKRYRALNAYWIGRLVKEIRARPGQWVGRMFRKGLYLFTEREIYNFEEYRIHRKESAVLRRLPVSFGVLWPLALASLALPVAGSGAARRIAWLLWAYVLLTGGAIALVYVSGRMRMPLVFPVALLAAGAVVGMNDLIRNRSRWGVKSIGGPLLLLGAGLAMSWGDWWGVRSEVVAHHDYARLSNAAWSGGRPERALAYIQKAEALRPGYARIPLLKAQALYALGRMEEAEAGFREAAEMNPRDPVPEFNLGMMAYDHLSDPARAIPHFQEALRRDPSGARAREYLVLSLLRVGETVEARRRLFPLIQSSTPPDLPTRLAWVALLEAEGNAPKAREVFQRWLAPLNEELLDQVRTELKMIKKENRNQN